MCLCPRLEDLKTGCWSHQKAHLPSLLVDVGCSMKHLTCDIFMWSGLPFNMMTEFKGKCSKKKRGAEGDLISFFDLDSEVRQHEVCLPHPTGWGSYNCLVRFKEKKCRSCLSLEECQHHLKNMWNKIYTWAFFWKGCLAQWGIYMHKGDAWDSEEIVKGF